MKIKNHMGEEGGKMKKQFKHILTERKKQGNTVETKNNAGKGLKGYTYGGGKGIEDLSAVKLQHYMIINFANWGSLTGLVPLRKSAITWRGTWPIKLIKITQPWVRWHQWYILRVLLIA